MSDGKKLKFLCMSLGDRIFALDIMGIKEILRPQPMTPVPQAPDTVKGIINVRGNLITVLDLRKVFSISATEPDPRETRIVIAGTANSRFGMMVDMVMDIAALDADEVDPAPTGAGGELVLGLFKKPGDEGGRVAILLRLSALAKMAKGEFTASLDLGEGIAKQEATGGGTSADVK